MFRYAHLIDTKKTPRQGSKSFWNLKWNLGVNEQRPSSQCFQFSLCIQSSALSIGAGRTCACSQLIFERTKNREFFSIEIVYIFKLSTHFSSHQCPGKK